PATSPGAVSRAISVPTSTVVPSATRICESVPSAGDGISTLILSVWISTSGSSLRTRSPCAFSQRPTVPSPTLSPSWGTTIELGISPCYPASAPCRRGCVSSARARPRGRTTLQPDAPALEGARVLRALLGRAQDERRHRHRSLADRIQRHERHVRG